MNLVVIRFKDKMFQFHSRQNVMLVGCGEECDIKIDKLPLTFSLLIDKDTFKVIPHHLDKNYKGFSHWNESISHGTIWGNELFHLLIPKIEAMTHQTSLDWDFSKLPKSPQNQNYLINLLEFICSSLKIDQIALLKRSHGFLTTLASKGIEIQDKTSFLLNNLLEENDNQHYFEVKSQLHSLIFQVNNNLNDFILIRNAITNFTQIVLYLPLPGGKQSHLQKELLKSLLFLFSQGVSLHLAYQKNSRLLKDIEDKDIFFWGKNLEMQRNKQIIDRLLNSDLSILVLGQTGTGKEMIAKYIAQKSGKKLITVNCSAIPKDLAESYLFGHKKGAFTGAIQDQIGKIKESEGGILFLDEIGELSKEVQAKLLRALQEKTISPIGGKEEKVQFRLISATHRNLSQMINQETFRQDLFYRINELSINIPSLIQRREDVLDLANYLLREIYDDLKINPCPLSLASQDLIQTYEWPGNIRELKAILKKSAILNDKEQLELVMGKIEKLPKQIDFNFEKAKESFIKNHLEVVLNQTNHNRTEAAKLLGIPVRSMFRLISTHLYDKNDIDGTIGSRN